MEKFKDTVLAVCNLKKISQSELARRAGMTPSNFQRVLNNVEGSRLVSLVRIADAAGLEIDLKVSARGLGVPRS